MDVGKVWRQQTSITHNSSAHNSFIFVMENCKWQMIPMECNSLVVEFALWTDNKHWHHHHRGWLAVVAPTQGAREVGRRGYKKCKEKWCIEQIVCYYLWIRCTWMKSIRQAPWNITEKPMKIKYSRSQNKAKTAKQARDTEATRENSTTL